MAQQGSSLLSNPTTIAALISFTTSIVVLYLGSWKRQRDKRKSVRRALKSEIKATDWIVDEETYDRLKQNIGNLEKPFGYSYIPTRIFDESASGEIGILPEAEDVANYYTQAHILQDFIDQIQGTDVTATETERNILANRQLPRFRQAHRDAIASIEEQEMKSSAPSNEEITGLIIFLIGVSISYIIPIWLS